MSPRYYFGFIIQTYMLFHINIDTNNVAVAAGREVLGSIPRISKYFAVFIQLYQTNKQTNILLSIVFEI